MERIKRGKLLQDRKGGKKTGFWQLIAEGVLNDVNPGESMFGDTTAVINKTYYRPGQGCYS